MFQGDGHIRDIEIKDVAVGMVLRGLNQDGSVAPFSDVVVTKVYTSSSGDKVFDMVRPFAFSHLGSELHSVERLGHCGARTLERYKLVMNSRGNPYLMDISR